ncbi:MAG TPA: hypothetical protein PLB10_19140 [Thiolinea sp.]|nr:hypothetical protein [Thiolinea sp.]
MTARTRTHNYSEDKAVKTASVTPITKVQDTTDLDEAASLYQQAKAAMAEAKAAMDVAERRLIELVANRKEEGTEKREGTRYKVSVRNGLNRSLNEKALMALQGVVPDEVLATAFKWKASLDLRVYRTLLDSNAPYLASLQAVVTAKPAKPTLTVEVL